MRMTLSVIAYTIALLCIAGIFYNVAAVAIGLAGITPSHIHEMHANIIGIIIFGISGVAIGEIGDALQRERGVK